MELSEVVVREVVTRLRRVEGQVGGVVRMVEEGRDCKDVLTQLSAASKALEQAYFRVVAAGLTYCLQNPELANTTGDSVEQLEKLFMKLS
ncbi:MAG: metal-sensitive transcriptional regulator [Acidimicrobiales bacterium]